MRLLSLLLAAGVALGSPPAQAAPDKVDVAPPTVAGAVPQTWSKVLQARAVQGIAAGGLGAHAIDPATSVDAPRAAGPLRAELTLEATGRDYALRLAVTELESGQTIAVATATCDTCGLSEVGDSVEELAMAVVGALSKREPLPATVAFVTAPAGAQIMVDGHSRGTTPLSLSLVAGEHTVAVLADDHVPHHRRIVLTPGEMLTVEASLAPAVAGEAAVALTRRRDPKLAMGTAGIVAGVGGLVAGITLLVLHGKPLMGRCTGVDHDLDGDCRYLHDTRTGGAVATGLGVAAVIAGGTLVALAVAHRRGRRPRVAGSAHPTQWVVRF